MLVVAFGFVVRPRPALAPVMGTGLPRPVPVRASRLRLSAGSELCELPAYPMSIYIEDTDAFAVTYYANYVRFFERAAYDWLGASACGELMRTQGLLLGVEALVGDACEVRGAITGLEDGVLSLRVALVRAAD